LGKDLLTEGEKKERGLANERGAAWEQKKSAKRTCGSTGRKKLLTSLLQKRKTMLGGKRERRGAYGLRKKKKKESVKKREQKGTGREGTGEGGRSYISKRIYEEGGRARSGSMASERRRITMGECKNTSGASEEKGNIVTELGGGKGYAKEKEGGAFGMKKRTKSHRISNATRWGRLAKTKGGGTER